MKSFRFGRSLRLGEIFTSTKPVLWSAMTSTTFSFFINPGIFVKKRLGYCWHFLVYVWVQWHVGLIHAPLRESSFLAATVLYPLLGVTW